MPGHHRVATVAAALLVVAVVSGGVYTYRTVTVAEAQAAYSTALTEARAAQSSAANAVAGAEAVVAAATSTLSDSAGKVPTDTPRTALATALDVVETQLVSARTELAAAERGIEAPTTDTTAFAPGSGLFLGAASLAALHFDHARELTSVTEALALPVQAVIDAVAEWQAEYDRIVATRYTNNTHATGWYPELDECSGSVDVTAHYGVPTIAEHWSCGGRDFPDDAGTIITLTGVHAGSYRVEGIAALLNANRDSTSDLPGGFDLLYQTCQNGQSSTMSFTGLTRLAG